LQSKRWRDFGGKKKIHLILWHISEASDENLLNLFVFLPTFRNFNVIWCEFHRASEKNYAAKFNVPRGEALNALQECFSTLHDYVFYDIQ
jgi:hypothetical protein